jgi:acetyl esterase/lipase
MTIHTRLLPLLLCSLAFGPATGADPIPPIPRVLPPEGLEIPADVQSRLKARLLAAQLKLDAIKVDFPVRASVQNVDQFLRKKDNKADADIFAKAVEFALLHREFFAPKDFEKADWAIDEANKRIDALKKGGDLSWETATGLVVQGYSSSIDASAQPYGLVIPKDHDFNKPCPLYVWLHGRGDKNTDLHFLQERATRPGQIAPTGAIVLHPFGRHCVGWKHAGENDVFEAIKSVQRRYHIDPNRVVLMGFSMGGAGAWHIGAHYTEKWVAVSPGAGFVDTARYQKITPERYPAWYEQKLWGLYDVPDYVRNLFNTNVIAYSGELDPQRQAAVLMEEAFKGEGRTLTHLIGPGVEHKYEPKTLEELLSRLDTIVAKGRDRTPNEVHWQSRTLRYPSMNWVVVLGLDQHWEDARVDAKIIGPKELKVATKNVTSLVLSPQDMLGGKVIIDDQIVPIEVSLAETAKTFRLPGGGIGTSKDGLAQTANSVRLFKDGTAWRHDQAYPAKKTAFPRAKIPHQQGPIDDAFLSSFLVITPTGTSKNASFQAWSDFELEHFRARWRSLMRGKLPEMTDVVFEHMADTADPDLNFNVILWGDPDSNSTIRRLLDDLPIGFSNGNWTFGGNTYNGNRFSPALIYPRRKRSGGNQSYLVLNSGLTFREGHDRTNSQQNPKLPDWAIIDITQPPDAYSPGRIHDAGFFDEQWQLKNPPKGP